MTPKNLKRNESYLVQTYLRGVCTAVWTGTEFLDDRGKAILPGQVKAVSEHPELRKPTCEDDGSCIPRYVKEGCRDEKRD